MLGEVDLRGKRKRKVTLRGVAALHGQRPCHESVWCLSPYEFVTYWQPRQLTYPVTLEDENRDDVHATVTQEGRAKIIQNQKSKDREELEPGV